MGVFPQVNAKLRLYFRYISNGCMCLLRYQTLTPSKPRIFGSFLPIIEVVPMVTNTCPEVIYSDNSRQIWTRLDTGFARIFASVSRPRSVRGNSDQMCNPDPISHPSAAERHALRPRSTGTVDHRVGTRSEALALQAHRRGHQDDRRIDAGVISR